jgi:DNA helicase II / ATP-dependent DNA helicase PcrA
MDGAEREIEIRRLAKIIQYVWLKIRRSREELRSSRGGLQEALEEFWNNPEIDRGDQSQLLEGVDRERSMVNFSETRQLQYQKMAVSPYFGRIDFAEKTPAGWANPEMIYIGIATLIDPKTGNCLIYDWRSPIAGMFYDFELGDCQYQCPAGAIDGRICLKRQYKIKNGRMEYMFDADVTIDDEMLQELLGKSVDDKMRTIVNTIQRDQNRIIRDETHPILLVMGPAGSGKTSVALHRAAYLLYRERKRITAKNILILSPNKIFSEYISDVLPELGEENVCQSTFRDYIHPKEKNLVDWEDFTAQMEYLLTGSGGRDFQVRTAGINYKSSARFGKIINNYLGYLSEGMIRDYPALDFQGRIFFSKEDWQTLFYKNLAYLPLTERLRNIRRRIQIQMRPLVHKLRHQKEQLIAATGEEVNERDIKALARIEARKELIFLTDRIERMTMADPLLLYRRLFEDEFLLRRLALGTEIPPEWPEICRQFLDSLDKGRIFYEDAIAFVYFEGCLTGFSVKQDIHHVIVDEAQDYNGLQFAILKKVFPKCSWTILGDPDQKVNPYHPVLEFDKIADILSLNQSASMADCYTIRLQKSYRSTWQIQAFAWALLGKSEPFNHIRRPGPRPRVIKAQDTKQLLELITRTIEKMQTEGWRSIAVITKTAGESRVLYEEIRKKINIHLLTDEMAEFHSGAVLTPVYLAKGLEFDAVLIYEAGAVRYHCEAERGLLYVACTRALHRLVLFYTGELTPLMGKVQKDLYEVVLSK